MKYNSSIHTKQPVYFGQKALGSYKYKSVTWSGAGKDGLKKKSTTKTANFYDKNAENPLVTQQKAFQQQMQASANAAAAANTKQLQIIQSEKSAVSKMMAEYSAQVKAEAEAKAKAQKEATEAAAASSANQSMMGKSANLQLQTASDTPKTAGTQGFKKLNNQFKINPSYNALGTMKSGTLNI